MTLVILEPQLGAMKPDVHGGTQTGVTSCRVTDCAFRVGLRAIPPRRGSHDKLLFVKLTCRWLCSGVCVCFAWVLWWGGWEVFPSAVLRHSGLSGSWKSAITFLLDSTMGSLCTLWSNTCSPLLPLFWFLVSGNLPRGNVVGKPSLWARMSCWGFILSTTST